MQRYPLLDQAVYDRMVADVGAETAKMLLESLKGEIKNSRDKLEAYLSDKDIALFENQAHALKSAARSFGAMQLGESCLSLEMAAKDKALGRMIDLMVEFRVTVSATLKEYEKV